MANKKMIWSAAHNLPVNELIQLRVALMQRTHMLNETTINLITQGYPEYAVENATSIRSINDLKISLGFADFVVDK